MTYVSVKEIHLPYVSVKEIHLPYVSVKENTTYLTFL